MTTPPPSDPPDLPSPDGSGSLIVYDETHRLMQSPLMQESARAFQRMLTANAITFDREAKEWRLVDEAGASAETRELLTFANRYLR